MQRYCCKWGLVAARTLAFGQIRNRYGNWIDSAAAICQFHSNGRAIGSGDGDGHIFQRQLRLAGIGMDLYVACGGQIDRLLSKAEASICREGKKGAGVTETPAFVGYLRFRSPAIFVRAWIHARRTAEIDAGCANV